MKLQINSSAAYPGECFAKKHVEWYIRFMELSVMLGIVGHFVELNQIVLQSSTILSLLLGFIGTLFYYANESKKNNINNAVKFWLLVALYIIGLGIINLNNGVRSQYLLLFIDLKYLLYFLIGGCFANESLYNEYKRFMLILSIISIVFSIWALFVFNYNSDYILVRLNTWTLPYFLYWMPCTMFAYCTSSYFFQTKHRMIYASVSIMYFILGLLFLKRSAMINILLIVVICVLLRSKRKGFSTRFVLRIKLSYFVVLFSIMAIIVLLYRLSLFDLLYNSVIKRFTSTTISTYDRAQEYDKYFEQADLPLLLFGAGAGNIVNGYSTLHVGVFNNILKGGIFLTLFWIAILYRTIKNFKYVKYFNNDRICCLCVTISGLISLFYEMSWGTTILIFGYATSFSYMFLPIDVSQNNE